MKMKRREFWKATLGLGAILPSVVISDGPSSSVEVSSIDPEDCIVVLKTHYPLSSVDRCGIQLQLEKWKEKYPQLKNLPTLLIDSEMDVNIIRRKDVSKI